MAGRSGAAAIEMELRDAAKALNFARIAVFVRPSNAALADGLDALQGLTPRLTRTEDELFVAFSEVDGLEKKNLRKLDVSNDLFSEAAYGVEIQSVAADGGERVIGVSLYLQ